MKRVSTLLRYSLNWFNHDLSKHNKVCKFILLFQEFNGKIEYHKESYCFNYNIRFKQIISKNDQIFSCDVSFSVSTTTSATTISSPAVTTALMTNVMSSTSTITSTTTSASAAAIT